MQKIAAMRDIVRRLGICVNQLANIDKPITTLITSRRTWLHFGFTLLATQWFGCRRHEDRAIESTKSPATNQPKVQSSDNVKEVRAKADLLLERIYKLNLPNRLPNWIAFHALLMYGNRAYETYLQGNADQNLQRVFRVVLNSDANQLGPYLIRDKLPYPRHFGPRFSQEHHPGQFLNYFSMSGGSMDAVLTIDGTTFSIRDMLNRTLLEARPSGELAYLVLALSYYLEPGREWVNKFGERLSLAQLVATLLKTPEATCLGTHRLAALARTFSRPALCEGDVKMKSLWPELEGQIRSAVASVRKGQSSDGTFSAPGVTPGSTSTGYDMIFYGGHSLEWITFLGREQARDDWVVRAVKVLIERITQTYLSTYRNLDEVGDEISHFDFDGLSHAVSAVRRWRDELG